jgi:spore coat polysaccharide biosynthesis protein SpsF (cytidylyltransferase family)
MSSTRLPGKVLAELDGRPALHLLLSRLSRARELDDIAVATSDDPSDDALVAALEEADVSVLRGPKEDVLERYRLAADRLECDAIARITGDCPLIDPVVVDLVVGRWRHGREDYVANCIEPRTFPDGMDTEVVSRSALEEAAAEATDPLDREHVTPFIRSRPDRFPQAAVEMRPAYGDVRITLDTPEDLKLLDEVVARAGPDADLNRILALLGLEPARFQR